jgi:hypothetical protein
MYVEIHGFIFGVMLFVDIMASVAAIACFLLWRSARKDTNGWKAVYDESMTKAGEERRQLDKLWSEKYKRLEENNSEGSRAAKEVPYLQDLVARMNTERNRALEMADLLRKHRERDWENVTCNLVRSLFHEKDGPRDELMMALHAEYTRETEAFIEQVGVVTQYPGPEILPKPARKIFTSQTAVDLARAECPKCGKEEAFVDDVCGNCGLTRGGAVRCWDEIEKEKAAKVEGTRTRRPSEEDE